MEGIKFSTLIDYDEVWMQNAKSWNKLQKMISSNILEVFINSALLIDTLLINHQRVTDKINFWVIWTQMLMC